MLKRIIDCQYRCNYQPYIRFISPSGENLWDDFLLQPDNVVERKDMIRYLPNKEIPIYIPLNPKNKDIEVFGPLYKKYMRFRPEVNKYIMMEYDSLIKDKRVLGIACRGTDYLFLKPKGHPIQPDIKDVIKLAKRKMIDLKCEHIYLMSEEKEIFDTFNICFPGKVIINKRSWFDSYYQDLYDGKKISSVTFERENDNYYKSLEYCSSIYLLSNCTALIGGAFGGSSAATYLNNGEYEFRYLFDLGKY